MLKYNIKYTKDGRKIYEAVPNETYFLAFYGNNTVRGGGLANTGWDGLKSGITKLVYVLSSGKYIELPRYNKYLHLVEASMSIDNETSKLYGKNYHFVYIKGFTGDNVITHKIRLRGFHKDDVGVVEITLDDITELNSYRNSWKDGAKWQ